MLSGELVPLGLHPLHPHGVRLSAATLRIPKMYDNEILVQVEPLPTPRIGRCFSVRRIFDPRRVSFLMVPE